MDWTPESLARRFHEAYARVAARRFGNQREPEPWESLPEQARGMMVEAFGQVLGVEASEAPPPAQTAKRVPTATEFEEAAQTAESCESEGDASEGRGDWYGDILRQIDETVTAPRIKRAMRDKREAFRK